MNNKVELMSQLFELVMRINLETEMAAWLDVSGHVDLMKVSVSASKESYMTKLTSHEFYYHKDYMDDKGEKDFMEGVTVAIEDLNNLLSAKWNKTYTAYCNLLDMSCSQVFTSEAGAKRWVKRMKNKYDKVHAIVGYKEELRKV